MPIDYSHRQRAAAAPARADSRTVFGQVMGLVAITCLFAALGAYIARDASGVTGIVAFVVAFVVAIFVLGRAVAASEQLGIAVLFFVGLLLGVAIGPIVASYAASDPGVVYQSAGATAGFIGIFGAYGYATSRDFSSWGRYLLFAVIGLIVIGLISWFVAIPGGNVVYAVLGLIVFGAFTMYDFNRLRRTGMEAATLIAASIFLDIFNVFQFMLMLFGGNRN